MKSFIILVASLFCSILLFGSVQLHGQPVPVSTIPYGDNKDAGHYAVLSGVRIYFEVYGKGDPLVLLHGNGGNIEAMK